MNSWDLRGNSEVFMVFGVLSFIDVTTNKIVHIQVAAVMPVLMVAAALFDKYLNNCNCGISPSVLLH